MDRVTPSLKFVAELILGTALFLSAGNALAAACTSIATGNWTTQTTWGAAGVGCVGAPGGIPGAGDTVVIAATNTVTLIANAAASTLTINAATAANGVNLSGFTLAVTGAVTMNAVATSGVTSTLNVGSGTLTAASIAIAGSGTGTRNTLVTVSTGTITTTGSITFSGTAAQARFTSTGASTVNVGANFGSGGTLTTSGTGVINFNGGAAQTIGTYTTYNNIQINNAAGGVTFTGTTTIGGNLSVPVGTLTFGAFTVVITGSTSVGGTLAITSATGAKTFTGDVTVSAGGTWNNSANEAISFGGNLANDGTFTSGTGVQTFTGATAQLTGGAAITFAGNLTANNNLTVNKSAGAVTVSGNLSVGTNLVIQAGTLSVAGTVAVTGTTDVSGTLSISSVTGTKTFTGAVTINNSGTWDNSINEAITLQGGLTNNGTFTSGTGIYTFNTNSQNIGGTNAISIASVTVTGVTLTNNGTLTIPTALAGTGGLTNNNNTTLNIGGTSAITTLTANAAGNTVNYTGAAQTVKLPATSYYNLIFSGSGVKTLSASAMTISNDFTMSGTATATAAAALTVGNDFTIGASNTFAAATFTHNVGGDFIHNGTFTASTSTFNFNGAAAQNITGTNGGTTTFNNLTLNNANGLTLSGTHNTTVNTTLTLTSGRLTTNANILYVASGNAVAGAGASTFVVGNLRKRFATGANVSRAFEVGTVATGVLYAPATIVFGSVGTAGDFTVSTTAGDHPNIATSTIDANLSINRYWTLTNNSVTFTAAAGNSLSFTYVNPTDYDAGADFNSFFVGRFNSPTWTEMTPSARSATVTTISGATITTANISADYQIAEHPLSCYTDDFNRADGAPGSGWAVSSSSGGFGNPVILNKRMRLTDATGNVATMATLQRIFPGAGNMIRVEFDHYAYGGTGADGIGVVFSDFSITPSPGAYGGSLGYAQKTAAGGGGADIPGFTGGWLGVGIDEFGNFSNPSEGRIGGPGARVESISVRGSGSGLNNYRYHAGTAANLVPTVDGNGAAVPAHRYRIKLDHSNNVNAFVSVERDIGAGFVTLVAAYDAKVQTSQLTVPTNWILSWTGSTGGSTNIHEITNLRVCATSQAPAVSLHHIRIEHNNNGLTCTPSSITVKACADAACSSLYTGAATTVTLSGSGWATNPITFTGSTSVNLAITTPQIVTLGTTGVSPVPTAGADCFNGSATNNTTACQLTFSDTGFIVSASAGGGVATIPTEIAGTPSLTYYLRAVKKSTTTQACEAALSGAQTISMAYECNNPTTCSSSDWMSVNGGAATTIARNNNGSVSSYTSVNMTFDVNGNAPFTFNFSDVGQTTLHAKATVNGATLTGNTNAFVVKPHHFDIDPLSIKRTSDNFANPGAGTAAGSVFMAAGDAFSATVTARTATGGATPNYGKETTPEGVKLTANLVAPAAGNNIALANGTAFGTFSNGVATGTTFGWGEVGIITLTPSVADADYLGAGDVSGTTSGNVGRFTPAYFTVDVTPACNAGSFTYSGQPFNTVTVTPLTVSGGTINNYQTTYGFSKDVTISDAGTTTNFHSTNTIPSTAFTGTAGSSSTVTYTFAVKETAPASITLRAVDTDNVSSSGHPLAEPTPAIRSGRIQIQNAFGSELVDLPMPMRAQYFKSAAEGWVINSIDTCTAVTLALTYIGGGTLASGDTCVQDDGVTHLGLPGLSGQGCAVAGPVTEQFHEATGFNGEFNLYLRKPAGGHTGSVDVSVDLSAMSWLRFNWDGIDQGGDGNLDDDDARGRANFGVFKGNRRHIYLRERY